MLDELPLIKICLPNFVRRCCLGQMAIVHDFKAVGDYYVPYQRPNKTKRKIYIYNICQDILLNDLEYRFIDIFSRHCCLIFWEWIILQADIIF